MAAMTIPGRVGVVLRDPLPWEDLVQVVETAEETGYQAVFVPEIAGREAFGTLAGLAGSTSRVRLGTGVVTVTSRSPIAAAMGAATIHDLSAGRMILGIGAGDAGRRRTAGQGPVELVERYVRLLQRVLAGEDVEDDPVLATPGFRLELPLEAAPPPVWLGALGDRMVALAGAIADGAILNWCTPGRVAEARRLIDRALAERGLDRSAFTLSVYVRACLGVAETTALDAVRAMTATYASLPHYRSQMEAMGLGEQAAKATAALAVNRPQDVPEDLVRALAVVGGRAEVQARLDEYVEAGADLVLCYPVAVLEPLSSILRTVLAAAPDPAVEH
jgi:alkanesulfonate monooxygenase SsuD/methylene tetrahydromethanopterin reductase-like flavin-dependent oxidoreductase (luciferase family)